MTESEAMLKMCHRTLAAIAIDNRPYYSPSGCIASQCMAWRWRDREPTAFDEPNSIPRRGFCGLAVADEVTP